eukprot:403372884
MYSFKRSIYFISLLVKEINMIVQEELQFQQNRQVVLMENVAIFHNEPNFYRYNTKRLLLILIQLFFQLQYIVLVLFIQDKIQWGFMNLFNWIYIAYLFCNKYNLNEAYRFSMLKDQLFLTVCFYQKDYELIYCLIPCLLITTVLYGRFNWERMKNKENILEGSLLMIVSLELMIHIIHREDFSEKRVVGHLGYIQRMYLIFTLCVILLVVIGNLFESQNRMLQKIQELQQQINTKEVYQAAMVHELRNPLGSVIGGVELLNHSKCLSNDDKKNLQIVQHSANILMSLIGNILDVAKLEANKVDLDQQYILFRPAIKNILDLVEFKAQKKQLNLQLEVSSDVPDYVFLDQSRFNQIILNLISNSVKFTSKGFVKVLVSYTNPNQQTQMKNALAKRNSAPGGTTYAMNFNDLIQGTSNESLLNPDSKQNSSNQPRQMIVSQSLVSDGQFLIGSRAPSYIDYSGKGGRKKSYFGEGLQEQKILNQNNSTPKVFHNIFNYNSSEYRKMFAIQEGQQQSRKQKMSFNYSDIDLNQTAKFSELVQDNQRQLSHSQNQLPKMLMNDLQYEERKQEKAMPKEVLHTTEIYEEEFEENIQTPDLHGMIIQSSILGSFDLNGQRVENYLVDNQIESVYPFFNRQISKNEEQVSFNQHLYENQQLNQRSNNSLLATSLQMKEKFPSEISFMNYGIKQQKLMYQEQQAIAHNPLMHSAKQSSIMRVNHREQEINQSIQSPSMSPSNQQDDNNPNSVSGDMFGENFQFPPTPQNNFVNGISIDPLSFQQIDMSEFNRVAGQFRDQQPQLSKRQSINSHRKNRSENRLEQFRKQNKLPQIKTRISDFKTYLDLGDQENQQQCDILKNQSPQLDVRNIPSNAPQIVQDPKIISENIQHGILKIIIQDSGIGIKEEDQKKLFQPFCQANKQIQSKFGGTGLGLWISNKLIQLMKGSQSLKSNLNVGTTFTIEIPTDGVSYEDSSCGLNSSVLNLDENLSKLSILVLIQDEFNKEILKKFLVKLNCPITFAKHYDDFLSKMKLVHIFNVFIVDADQFTLSQQSKVKKLIKHKRAIENKTNKSLSMLVLSTLDMDARQRNKYLNDRVLIFRKPVKQNILRNCLYQIQKKERQHSVENMRRSPKQKIRNQISEDLSARNSLQNLIGDFRMKKLTPLQRCEYQDQEEEKTSQSKPPYKISDKQMKSVVLKKSNLIGMIDTDNVQTPVFTNQRRNRILDITRIDANTAQQQKPDLCSQIMDHESQQFNNSKTSKGNNNAGLDFQEEEEDDDEEIKDDQQHQQLQNNQFKIKEQERKQRLLNESGFTLQVLNNQKLSSYMTSLNKSETFMANSILIVDDDYYNRYILEKMIEQLPEVQQYQIQFLQASDGEEGLESFKIQYQTIKLILTDLNMDKMNGNEMALKIRDFEQQNYLKNAVAIIGITGEDVNSKQFKKLHSKEATGIDQFCTKPANIQYLQNIIRQVFEQHI